LTKLLAVFGDWWVYARRVGLVDAVVKGRNLGFDGGARVSGSCLEEWEEVDGA
jgi:hypothetical protein